jgi:putative ABC transport system ATP-binding protein
MSQNGTAVSLRGVTKTFGSGSSRVQALRGIDLEVRPGELLMLVGPSGCGKTTLISVVAAILDHDDGEIVVFDRDLKSMSQAEKTRFRGANIGFVFQAYNLIPTLTVAENTAIPLFILGKRRADALTRAGEVLEAVGLGDKLEAIPAALSGGQQQRVAIARAIVNNPRLIVCDEPTSALDADTGRLVMDVLRRNALSEDRALIIVTHDNRIFSFADRIAKMDDGRVIVVEPQVATS